MLNGNSLSWYIGESLKEVYDLGSPNLLREQPEQPKCLPFPGIGLLLRGQNAKFLQQPAVILSQFCGLQGHAMGKLKVWQAFFGARAAGILAKTKPKPAQYTANQSNHTSLASIPFKTSRFENHLQEMERGQMSGKTTTWNAADIRTRYKRHVPP
jgi:hypothetical protein